MNTKPTDAQALDLLKRENESLRNAYDSLSASYANVEADNAHLTEQVEWLMEQLNISKRRQFGQSSEKSEYDQATLFNEAETFADPESPEPEITRVAGHTRKKRRATEALPEDLPVEVVECVLPPEEQACPACGEPLHVMGKTVTRRELKLVPASAVILEYVQYTYACRNCDRTGIQVPVIKAPVPKPVISGSIASPEAIAHVMTEKFIMGNPLYRQEQQWKRQGILLSRQTMSNWLIRASADWLEPIYDELHRRLLTHDCLHADETTLQVIREPGKSAGSKSYMWIYRTSGDAERPIVLLDYQPGRGHEYPAAFLEGFSGYLHTDGHSAYRKLEPGITVVGCLAHARRKFDEALKTLKPEKREGSGAYIGRRYCDRLFALERELADLSSQERHEKRQELAAPILDDFLSWLDGQRAPKNALGKAVYYCLNQWDYLKRYLLDGRLEISNNRAERAIRPFVIGRKNFLFCVSPAGAKSSAVIYSIVETAKENGLNPFEYLTFLFRELPSHAGNDLTPFLPGSPTLPEICFVPQPKAQQPIYAWDVD